MNRLTITALLLTCFTVISTNAHGLKISYSATIPRSVQSQGFVDVSVTVTDIFASEAAQLTAAEMQSRLEVFMPQISDSRLPYAGDGSHGFYATYEGDLNSQTNATTGNLDLDFTIRVHEDTFTYADLMNEEADTLTISMDFDAGEQGTVTGENVNFVRDISVANQPPSSLSTKGLHHAIRATWSTSDTISYTSGDPKPAAGAVLLAIPRTSNGLALPSFLFGGSDPDTSSSACYFDDSLVGTSTPCIVCPASEDHYLDISGLQSLEGVILRQTNNARTSTEVLSPLTPGTDYAIFVYHLPDGVARSACLAETPIETSTMSELLGEAAATTSDAAWNVWSVLGIFSLLLLSLQRERQ